MNPTTNPSLQSLSDDLARALANVQAQSQSSGAATQQSASLASPMTDNNLHDGMAFEDFDDIGAIAPKASPGIVEFPSDPGALPGEPVITMPKREHNPEVKAQTNKQNTGYAEIGKNDVSSVAPPMGSTDKIDKIKVEALNELRPLMSHLDLSPEEKFEKYLMMLRATDDLALIEETFKAAKNIANEQLRAQALVDVINEISYLTTIKK